MKIVMSLAFLLAFETGFPQKINSPRIIDTVTTNYSNWPRKFTLNQVVLPTSLMLTGIALSGSKPEALKYEVAEERDERFFRFKTHVDDYLQFSPIALAYGMDLVGLKSRNDLPNRTAILIKGEIINTLTTQLLKYTTHVQRPDHSGFTSFPSGHTSQAFAVATFLTEEYRYKYKWIPYLSYGLATTVGMLRIANNKHYINDVLVGAGVGILSMKVSYWTHQYKWKRKKP
ncbi:MAG: phosphatase PAP2 family protein [Bacteroidetes bacterium]|nr:phosphatase PAP2 family protein [Bacteroidota bacterium]